MVKIRIQNIDDDGNIVTDETLEGKTLYFILNKEIKRAQGMLANEKFVSKAPEAKVQEERAKLEKYTQMLAQVKERMAGLGR